MFTHCLREIGKANPTAFALFSIGCVEYAYAIYLTESDALLLVAPIPGALCLTCFRVCENSPSLWASMSASIITCTHSLPL